MRVAVLGGTGFIGRAVSGRLLEAGHAILVVHRGPDEPGSLQGAQHLHVDRARLPEAGARLEAFGADVVVDCYALTREDARIAADCFPGVPSVVLSSQDVYTAWTGFLTDTEVADVPLTESSPLRRSRYLYADAPPPGVPHDYEKLDVEEEWGRHGATILRLPMVYGPHDAQRRETFVLRRLAAGRTRIPVGAGNLRISRAHVTDVASAVEATLRAPQARGQVVNLAEPDPVDIRTWMLQIGRGVGTDVDLVRVPDDALPDDLLLTGRRAQHVVVDVTRAHALLGWRPVNVEQRVADSARWHVEHDPCPPWTDQDEARDERALAHAVQP